MITLLVWGFFVQRMRTIIRNSRSFAIVFAFPMLLAGVGTLVAVFSPHGTFGSYAYTQMDALPVIQVASLAGTAEIYSDGYAWRGRLPR